MARTTTIETAPPAPQVYILQHHMGKRGGAAGDELWRPGDRATAAELLPGLDPDYIETRIPELIANGAIRRAEDPAPAPRQSPTHQRTA